MACKATAWGKVSGKSLGTQSERTASPAWGCKHGIPALRLLGLHHEILIQDNKKEKGRKKKKRRKKPPKIFAFWYVCLYVVPSIMNERQQVRLAECYRSDHHDFQGLSIKETITCPALSAPCGRASCRVISTLFSCRDRKRNFKCLKSFFWGKRNIYVIYMCFFPLFWWVIWPMGEWF